MKTLKKITGFFPIIVAVYLFVVLIISAFSGVSIEEYVDVKWWGLFLLVELWAERKMKQLHEIE